VLHVALQLGVLELATNETFGVKDSLGRRSVECSLGSISDTKKKSELGAMKAELKVLTDVHHHRIGPKKE
jgi:hypothetical protein